MQWIFPLNRSNVHSVGPFHSGYTVAIHQFFIDCCANRTLFGMPVRFSNNHASIADSKWVSKSVSKSNKNGILILIVGESRKYKYNNYRETCIVWYDDTIKIKVENKNKIRNRDREKERERKQLWSFKTEKQIKNQTVPNAWKQSVIQCRAAAAANACKYYFLICNFNTISKYCRP